MTDGADRVEPPSVSEAEAAIARLRASTDPTDQRLLIEAMFQRAFAFVAAQDDGSAERAFDDVITAFSARSDATLDPLIASAYVHRAGALERLGRNREAVEVTEVGELRFPEILLMSRDAIELEVDQARALVETGNEFAALELLERVVNLRMGPNSPALVVEAVGLWAQASVGLGPNAAGALAACDQGAARARDWRDPGTDAAVGWLFSVKAWILASDGKHRQAVTAIDEGLEYLGESQDETVRRQVVDLREERSRWEAAAED